MTFGPADRAARIAALTDTEFDLLVVGGGITGVATARDAAMRGYKVALVEKEDFAYGTSSRSSKLIHGGLRYLEQANFRLVFEGTQERATLRKVAPHLVRPIQFLVPVYEESKHGVLTLGVGLWLYDQLAGKRRYARHSRHGAEQLLNLEPSLRTKGLRGGATYYDCMTDDARLCIENAIGAHEAGANLLNKASFVGPTRGEDGRITGGLVRDELSGAELQVKCKVLVSCAGPWTDKVLASHGNERGMIRTSKGAHILFAHDRLPVNHAVVMASRRDRRVVFAIPRGRVTLVGTTDTDFDGDPDQVHATGWDVDYLLETVNHYFPDQGLGHADIQATYAGLRPLVRDDSDSPYDVSREHTVVTTDDGTVTIGGGKYTTYRRMASDVVRACMKVMAIKRKERPRCPTAQAALPGADGFSLDAQWEEEHVAERVAAGLDEETAAYLVGTYGARHPEIDGSERLMEGLPFTVGEIDHAVTRECALTLSDVLVRRLPIFYEAADQGLECADRVADVMGARLGWSDAERAAQIEAYQETVAQSRRWKDAGEV